MGLVLSNSNFFINKNSQGRKSVREKSTYSLKFGFMSLNKKTRRKILMIFDILNWFCKSVFPYFDSSVAASEV